VSTDRAFVMRGTIAIPIGHAVECFILSRDIGTFSKDIKAYPDEPLLRDLQTGIYYGRPWHLAPGELKPQSIPRTTDPAEGVAVVERFAGRVKVCIVTTDGDHAQTTLVIDMGPTLT
jgi:hypothetical protein